MNVFIWIFLPIFALLTLNDWGRSSATDGDGEGKDIEMNSLTELEIPRYAYMYVILKRKCVGNLERGSKIISFLDIIYRSYYCTLCGKVLRLKLGGAYYNLSCI